MRGLGHLGRELHGGGLAALALFELALPVRDEPHEFGFAAVDEEHRRPGLVRLVARQAQGKRSGLGRAAGHGQGRMPRLVLIAHAQVIVGNQLDVRLEERAALRVGLHLAHETARTGLAVRGRRLGHALRQEPGAGRRTAQRHFENLFGVLAGLRIVRVVAQHLVGRDDMIDVVRPLLAAFDLPAIEVRDVGNGLGEHVQREVEAGEEPPGMAALLVHAAAGLHAPAPQAALAAHVARPVAAARNAPAQRTVDEAFQVEALGAGFAHAPDFVDGQLARQDDAVRAQFLRRQQGCGMRQIGERGQEQAALVSGLTREREQAGVLNDQAVRLHVAGETGDEASGGGHVVGLHQRVEGDVDAPVVLVGEFDHAGKLGGTEVVRLHAGGKMFEAEVYGVGSGGHRREERLRIARRGENLRLARHGCVLTMGRRGLANPEGNLFGERKARPSGGVRALGYEKRRMLRRRTDAGDERLTIRPLFPCASRKPAGTRAGRGRPFPKKGRLPRTAKGLFEHAGVGDEHGGNRHVGVDAAGRGLFLLDLVDGVHAFDDLAEHAIAVAVHVGGGEVQEPVVHGVDEELGRGAVGIGGAGHRDGAAFVAQAVVGFVLDGGVGFLFFHLHVHAAALNHEALDDAVENRVGVEALVDVLEEVFHGDGGFIGVQFDEDVPGGRFQQYGGIGHDILLAK